jgi:hypothetical protein
MVAAVLSVAFSQSIRFYSQRDSTMSKFNSSFAALAILGTMGSAQAALVSTDTTFGVGTATLDTDTNLLWLDHRVPLSFSVTSDDTGDGDGFETASYRETVEELQPGRVLDGWRYATGSEVLAFFSNSGANTGFMTTADAETRFFAFQNLIGAFSIDVTGDGRNLSIRALVEGTSPSTLDLNGDGLLDGIAGAIFLDLDRQDPTNPDGRTFTFNGPIEDWRNIPSFPSGPAGTGPLRIGSHWLVRSADTAVPEPVSGALLVFGLGAMAWRRRSSAVRSL